MEKSETRDVALQVLCWVDEKLDAHPAESSPVPAGSTSPTSVTSCISPRESRRYRQMSASLRRRSRSRSSTRSTGKPDLLVVYYEGSPPPFYKLLVKALKGKIRVKTELASTLAGDKRDALHDVTDEGPFPIFV